MNPRSRCAFCGAESDDRRAIASGLVRYAEPDAEGNVFGRLPRCTDHRSCRSRVEGSGEPWLVADNWQTEVTV
jgi:hypothetical protein